MKLLKYIIVAGIIFIIFILNNFEAKGIYSCINKEFVDISKTGGKETSKYSDFKFTWYEGLVVHKVVVNDGFLKGTFKVFGNKNNFNSIVFFDQPSHLINYYNGDLFYIHSSHIAAQALLASCKEET